MRLDGIIVTKPENPLWAGITASARTIGIATLMELRPS